MASVCATAYATLRVVMVSLRRGRAAAMSLARAANSGEGQGMANTIARIPSERRRYGESEPLQDEETNSGANDDRARGQLSPCSEQSHTPSERRRCANVNDDREIFFDCCEGATVPDNGATRRLHSSDRGTGRGKFHKSPQRICGNPRPGRWPFCSSPPRAKAPFPQGPL
jgi:hypothetical protein